MKNVNKMAFQGDVCFRRVDSIPESVKKQDHLVVAHSETGHNHVVECDSAILFKMNDMISFLDLKKQADVVHKRSFDTHETLRLPAGKWEVRRQREWAPEGWRRVED